MVKRDERAATSLTKEEKLKLEALSRRKGMSESEFLRELVRDAIEDADIPDEVLDWLSGNRSAAATALAK